MAYNSKYTGAEVENLLDQIANGEIGGGITTESDPIFSASPAASITEDKKTEWDNKVDKVSGKQLSTEDFTSTLKSKLEGLNNYDDTELSNALSTLRGDFDKLVSGDTTTAIKTFNEVIAFLDGIQDTQDLSSIIASIEQQVAGKMDKVTLATVATSGDYNDLNNKPAIPTKTSELTNDSTFITSTDNVASATKLQTMRYINGLPFDGTSNVVSYAVCATGASVSVKTVNISNFNLITGSQVRVKFNNTNTATAPTLNVGSTGAKRMSYKGSLITNANFSFSTAKIYTFTYDGTYWVLEGDWDEAPKTSILTCEFMGEVGDVIWSDGDDHDRMDYIAEWMEALSLGKVCVLDFDEYEGTYAMVHAINYRTDATYGIGKAYFSYIFEGYLYDVEYESVSLPVTLTIVSKTKVEGGGGSNAEPMVCAYRILSATANHIELDNYTYNGQTMYYREGAIISILNPNSADVVFEGGTLTLDGNEYEADAFTIKVGATALFTLGVDSGILFPVSSVVESNSGGSSEGGGSTAKEVVTVLGDTIDLLEPNKIYLLSAVSNSLQISEIAYPEGVYAEYCIMSNGSGFGGNNSSMSLILPDNMVIYWAGESQDSLTIADFWELSIVYTSSVMDEAFKCVLTKFT